MQNFGVTNKEHYHERRSKRKLGWGGGGGGCSGTCSPGKFIFGILTFKSPLFWISESFRQDIGQFQWLLLLSKPVWTRALAKCSPNFFVPIYYHTIYQVSTWKVFLLKVYLFMKHLTDFRKTLETGVDPHLIMVCHGTFWSGQ